MHRVLRQVVPRPLRRSASVQIARLRSAALKRRLAALAADSRPIVAGPWLGEVGFELLYWVPFLRWFAEEFGVDPARLVVVSRGGTWSWYEPFAGKYREVFDYVGPEEFRNHHDDRVQRNGEQKQTREVPFEQELVDRIARRTGMSDVVRLHPAWMFEAMNPFWWQHLDESWVHRHTRYRRLSLVDRREAGNLPPAYIAVKFYFNDSFPRTDRNAAFVRAIVRELSEHAPIVSLSTDLTIDDHGGALADDPHVTSLSPPLDLRRNLHVQSAIVAGASAFVGTYGGFSYLAPFYGVPSTAYYDDEGGFSKRHLAMARSAFAAIGVRDLLEVRAAHPSAFATRV
jgi:hypothetical protein